jgi:integrase
MGRTVKDTRLETRQARLRLTIKKDREPYWRLLRQGLHLGYRKSPQGGVWMVRLKQGDRYIKKTLAQADDFQDSNGETVISYAEAQKIALGYADRDFSPLTIKEATDHYLKWFKEHRKAYDVTLMNVNAHILPHFGKVLVTDLKTVQIRKWLNNLAATPARKRPDRDGKIKFKDAPQTDNEKRARKASANRVLTILKAILNKAFQDELVSDDTAWRRVKSFANADEPVIRFLTEAECTRLINAARPDLRQIIKAALFTGARYSEITGLAAKNVNPDTAAIYIQPAKSGKGRHIPLSAEGLDFFKTACAGKIGDALVFTKEDGTKWGRHHQDRLLKAACTAGKIEPNITFHELRHTYASLLAQAGADLLTISKLLGHADTRITSRHYAHLCDKTLANTVNKLLPSFGHKAETHIVTIDLRQKLWRPPDS